MPSTRRVKLVAILLAIVICTILYLSNDSSSQDFYSRTVAALDKKQASDAEVERKLQEVKEAAKAQEPAAGNAPQKPLVESATKDASHVDGGVPKKEEDKTTSEKEEESEKSVAGRKTMKGEESKDLQSGQEAPTDIGKDKEKNESKDVGKKENAKEDTAKSKENHEIEVELNLILKKGPIIIFSKTYCPHSAKAKRILLEKYTIVPAPYVVELDKHPLGSGLQSALEKSTGRRTVPNVLISGRSIGGGDDVQALDEGNTLVDKVKSMGGKRIMEAKLAESTIFGNIVQGV